MIKKLDEEYAQKIKEADDTLDTETAHFNADKLLCELLKKLGYDKVVEAFDGVGKWYA